MSNQLQVHGTINRMTSALERSNIDEVMTTYEPNAVILFEPATPVNEPITIRELFKGLVAVNPDFKYGEHEVVVAGDLALHLMPWTMSGTAPDGSEIAQGGLSIAVLRRQPDGNWLMVIDNPHGQRLLQTSEVA